MERHVSVALLACSIAALVSGCSLTGSEPKRALSRYFDASLNNRHEEAYDYISEQDRVVRDLDDYISSREDKWMLDTEIIRSKMSYKVKDVEVDGDHARARVEVTMPDMVVIATDIFGAVLTSIFEDEDSQRDLEEKLKQKYERGNIPMTTKVRYYDLIRDTEGWKVYFGWEAEVD